MPYIVTQDIRSHATRGRVYATRYSEVEIISRLEHVYIAESKSGRFPVRDELVMNLTPWQYKSILKRMGAVAQAKEAKQTPVAIKRLELAERKLDQLVTLISRTNKLSNHLNF